MSIDLFNPPQAKLTPSSFASRRDHLVHELEHARSIPRLGHFYGFVRRRPLVALAVVLVSALVPLSALAVANDWYFFRFGGAPAPVTAVVVVKSGSWDGKSWELVAYRSRTDGLCFAMARAQSEGEGGAMGCDQIEGVPRTPESKPYTPHAITYLTGSGGELPAYIVGPVTDRADEVAIYLADGAVLRTPAFDAPSSLGSSIRFYAAQLPESVPPLRPASSSPIEKLVGLDSNGQIVACLTVPTPSKGVPLSACR